MWISKHNRGGRSVLFGGIGGEERKREGENNHTTQPWTMSRSIRGNSGGGGLAAYLGPGEGESGTLSHAPHAAWHALPAPTAVIWLTHHFMLCTQLPGNPGRPLQQHPPERREPSPPSPRRGGHGPAARHILRVLQTQRS